jgi:FkbM family methyltransferase
MTFISYAQNFEDVLLWRALGHIKNGFYIDVGANDPVEHSVTKAFYDAGWHGINIEPLPSFHQEFLKQRPRDINLAIAAGAADGSLTLFDVPSVNGWASPDAAVAEAHRADGFEVTELTVPVRTLAGVCEEHVRGDIHFLKVDVEGFEGEVLRGMDFEKWRPWLLVIEATLPNSRVTNHESWEALVTNHCYRYAHFDGLNRYYVADEHAELLELLSIQPNVFDEFITHHLDKAWAATAAADAACARANERLAEVGKLQWAAEQRADRADSMASQAITQSNELLAMFNDANKRADQELHGRLQAESQLDAERARADHLQHTLNHLSAWAKDLEQRLLATHNSTSWKITRPLRALVSLLRSGGAQTAKAQGAAVLRSATVRITRSERMRRLLIPILLRFPNQAARVSQMLNTIKQDPANAAPPSPVADMPDEVRALPASARKVLADLQRTRRNSTGT